MSAFTKLAKSAEATQAAIAKITEEWAAVAEADDNANTKKRRKLGELLASLKSVGVDVTEKLEPGARSYLEKKDAEDPVSGSKRFGVAMQAKITALHQEVETMSAGVQGLLQTLAVAIESCPAAEEEDDEQKSEREKEVARLREREEEKKRESEAALAEEKAREERRLQKLKEEEEMSRRAEAIRERKAQEQAAVTSVHQQQQAKLKDILDILNKRYSPVATDASVDSALRVITAPLAAGAMDDILLAALAQEEIRTALQTMLDILDQIVKRPDDVKARKMRIGHPVLRAKLTALSGGIDLILAAGYQASLIAAVPADTPSAHSASSSSSPSSSSSAATSGAFAFSSSSWRTGQADQQSLDNTNTNSNDNHEKEMKAAEMAEIFSLLTPLTSWDVLLELHEPKVDVDNFSGKNAWLEWFDSVSIARSRIEACLIAVS